jgi:peptidoglycan LD-endopeptidase LytH
MTSQRARSGWVSSLMAMLAATLFLTACSTTATIVATPAIPQSEDDDFSQLIAQMATDLNRYKSREVERTPSVSATAPTKKERDREFAARAKELFSPLNESLQLSMPVVGVQPFNLYNSWGDARDGGRRKHRGIDIFAPKGTPVVACADGIVSFIGEQPKGGLCVWLTTENGASFYYAHLERWASGLYEGMEVRAGDLLGFVGNTGNAKTTPPHLHFGVNQNDEMVNPYPILTKAAVVKRARIGAELGGAMGTR